jgi:hypothetical protein
MTAYAKIFWINIVIAGNALFVNCIYVPETKKSGLVW